MLSPFTSSWLGKVTGFRIRVKQGLFVLILALSTGWQMSPAAKLSDRFSKLLIQQ